MGLLRQREERHPVLIRGQMRADGPFVDVCVRNVSKNGMMLQAHQAPQRGAFVEVRLPEDVIVGQVVWASDRRFGIRTRDRVPIWRVLGQRKPASQGGGLMHRPVETVRPALALVDARAFGRAAEFLILALAVTAIGGMLAFAGYEALSGVTTQITTHL